MTTNHLFALIIMLILPVCTAFIGFKRMTNPVPFGARGGYSSERARVSTAAWAFAQKACGVRYVIGGIAMVVCSVALTMILPEMKTALPMIVYGLVFASAWLVVNLVLMVLTEFALIGQHFAE